MKPPLEGLQHKAAGTDEQTEFGASKEHAEMTLQEMLQTFIEERLPATRSVGKVAKVGYCIREMPSTCRCVAHGEDQGKEIASVRR